jgi:hypothetical protein
MTKREQASRLRQELVRTEELRDRHLDVLVGTRQDLVRGSFVVVGRKCGKPTCKCSTGDLHPTRHLSSSEEGRTRIRYVPAADDLFVREAADRYRRFRTARAALAKLSAKVLSLADDLQECLTVPYPPPAEGKRPQPKKGARQDVPTSATDQGREGGEEDGSEER